MKIFVAGPDLSDSFANNVAYTFREMGHHVVTDSRANHPMLNSAVRRGLNEFLERAWKLWRLRGARRAIDIARRFKPDLTVMCTLTYEPESVEAIRQVSGGSVVLWYCDPRGNLPRDHVVTGEYDAVFAKDPDFTNDLRRILGIEAYHLAEACNPAWHVPVAGRGGDSIVVAGTAYGYRNAFVERLMEAGVDIRIYGPDPSLWVSNNIARAHTRRFLDQDSKAFVFGEALACLNTFAPSEGRNNLNARIFEACACGGVLLTEQREAINNYFECDLEYLAYGSLEECLEHHSRLLKDPSGGKVIRERAVQRAHGEHTYRHRLEKMLAILEM